MRVDRITAPQRFNTTDSIRNAVNHAFGTLEWRASPRWLFNVGAMIEDNSLTGRTLAPRASANYHITDSQTWRVSVNRSHRNPVAFEQKSSMIFSTAAPVRTPVGTFPAGTPISQTFRPSPQVQAERITTYELGYRAELRPLHASLDARIFLEQARELIEMGVRCVVAAGWEVRDDAGQTFAETFFEQMAIAGANFGNAIHVARRVARERHPDCNTWGAYQAYGDPAFALRTQPPEASDEQPLLAPDELIDWLEQRCLALQLPDGQARRGEIGFKALKAQVDKRLGKVQAEWAELPEVRQAIGKLYAEFGPDGFEAAHEALLQAVAGSSGQGQVAIQAIELLANIEARQAERLARQGRPGALQMADDAVARIEALVRLSAASPTAPQPAAPAGSRPNVERQSILGSAYKRKAIVQLLDRQAWRDIQPTLALARDAYARGAGEPDSPGWDPYGLINRLQLDALLGDVAAVDPQLIAACQAAARLRFGQTWDFFDAVKPVDASLALWLADTGSLGPTPGAELKRLYQDAAHQLYRSTLEFDSVVTQVGLLADFLRCRDAGDPRCAVLDALAVELGGAPAAGPPARQAKPQRKGARKPGQAG